MSSDPLWSIVPEELSDEFTLISKSFYIYPSAQGLPALIDFLYEKYFQPKANLRRNVSHSMFAYYCAVATFVRMLDLQRNREPESLKNEERTMVVEFLRRDFTLPPLLASYLAGFGSFRLPSGPEYEFSMMTADEYVCAGGVGGWFGRVGGHTQGLYQNYPCVAVFIWRMLEDVTNTKAFRMEVAPWSLPAEIMPENNGGSPTEALLGYRPATSLTDEQMLALADDIITVDDGSLVVLSHIADLTVNFGILIGVKNRMEDAGLRLVNMPRSHVGSRCQLALVQYVGNDAAAAANATQAGADAVAAAKACGASAADVYKTVAVLRTHRLMEKELMFPASAFGYRPDRDIVPYAPAPWVVWQDVDNPEMITEMAGKGNSLRELESFAAAYDHLLPTISYSVEKRIGQLDEQINAAGTEEEGLRKRPRGSMA